VVVDNFFRGAARLGRLHPSARPERHGVEVIADVPYGAGGDPAHRLDIYRPIAAPGESPGPRPVVLYVHGGGFRILSKETHWVMGLAFARRGYVVFNVGYRLAPRDRFPAALVDVLAAYRWVAAHAAEYGGDLDRFVFAGESAGANLVASATIATTFCRPEPWAREAFDVGVVPRAVIAACGMLQVSDTQRFARRRSLPSFVVDRLLEVPDAYLGPGHSGPPLAAAPSLALADPLLVFESDVAPDRPLPPFFAPVGTRDPVLDDTRRLAAALRRRGIECEDRYYPGQIHAFHAFVIHPAARRCWADTYAFLDRALVAGPR
jgi:acetyl esterase